MPGNRNPGDGVGKRSQGEGVGKRGQGVGDRSLGDGVGKRSQGDGVAFLRAADPVLRKIIDRVGADGLGDPRAGRPEDHYGALVRSIVGQQLSTKAARAIYSRLIERFGGRTPTPEEVLADDPDELRLAAGLSHAKVRYLRSLAEHIGDGSLELDRLDLLPDDEVIADLTAVSGIGPWSAHMFLMFHLQRPDVLAVGDLGIRRAVMVAYSLTELPSTAELERIAEPWRPYRTLACRFLWRSLGAMPV
ncbi:MAG: DNA-3-methyladenine glycosylase 2 family protein [Solirubrobacterales bacterium]|nr:DNA-3-methyladenine glycosylase 2 family protein [Solirubrobacterales bacterium]